MINLNLTLNQVKAGTNEEDDEEVEFLSLTNSSLLTPSWKFEDWVLMNGLIVSTNFKPVSLKFKIEFVLI